MMEVEERWVWQERWKWLMHHICKNKQTLLEKADEEGLRTISKRISELQFEIKSEPESVNTESLCARLLDAIVKVCPELGEELCGVWQFRPSYRQASLEFVKIVHEDLNEINEMVLSNLQSKEIHRADDKEEPGQEEKKGD